MGQNCVASSSIGCLFCCHGCNAEKLRNAFTFIPPPSSYAIEYDREDKSKGRIAYRLEALENSQLYRQAAEVAEVHWLTKRNGSKIPMVWLHREPWNKLGATDVGNATAEPPPIILLHCHGNATDVGMMMGPYYELAKVLGIEVVGLEYTGYGAVCADETPSADKTYADIEAAYDYLVRSGVVPNRIVAYGQSVGSGPVSWLAARKPLGGIILHSPLLSGIKVIDPQPDRCCRPSCVFACFDFYPNNRNVQHIRCPIFVMHGQKDDVVPFYHGSRLHQACPKEYRCPAYFPARASHNDIVEIDMRAYFGEVSNFLYDVKRRIASLDTFAFDSSSSSTLKSMHQGLPVFDDAAVDCPRAAEQNEIGVLRPEKWGVANSTQPRMLAGPEDGRYAFLRQGNAAREVTVKTQTSTE